MSPNKEHSERRVAFAGLLELRHDLQGFVIGAEEQLEIMVSGLECGAQRLGIQRCERLLPFPIPSFCRHFLIKDIRQRAAKFTSLLLREEGKVFVNRLLNSLRDLYVNKPLRDCAGFRD